uniref:Uncharacterized protein n=1 Tax=Amphimedon queenslandica TaxID=400682 RepID=A0A1X7URF9_AMPQE
MNMVSPRIKPSSISSSMDTKRGHPLATFISDFGFWNEELSGSGWNMSMMSRAPH